MYVKERVRCLGEWYLGLILKDDKEFLRRKGRESMIICVKCLSCLGNNREFSVGRILGFWLGVLRIKVGKLNWIRLVYVL